MLDLRLENIVLKQQGLFSRPFTEVIINPRIVSKPLAYCMTFFDIIIEKFCTKILLPFS